VGSSPPSMVPPRSLDPALASVAPGPGDSAAEAAAPAARRRRLCWRRGLKSGRTLCNYWVYIICFPILYVCIYVYICIYIYIHIYIYVRVYIYIYIYVCVHTSEVLTHTYIFSRIIWIAYIHVSRVFLPATVAALRGAAEVAEVNSAMSPANLILRLSTSKDWLV